jgi:hypothetical protein
MYLNYPERIRLTLVAEGDGREVAASQNSRQPSSGCRATAGD